MIAYTTVGSNDLQAAASFYNAIFDALGVKKIFNSERFITWGTDEQSPMFGIVKPYNKQMATAGNGTMIAIAAGNTNNVNHAHAQALSLGASNEGDPGLRGTNFYCAYFRDLDGNKINLFCLV